MLLCCGWENTRLYAVLWLGDTRLHAVWGVGPVWGVGEGNQVLCPGYAPPGKG